ncbi:hypothetical protein, partial [Mesorhizobium sp. M0859]|uniref:hypothetical protein n=1 Tax=Mesorhizobium sp. M0859 TaxID=2957014 RepID=UPI00333BD0F7
GQEDWRLNGIGKAGGIVAMMDRPSGESGTGVVERPRESIGLGLIGAGHSASRSFLGFRKIAGKLANVKYPVGDE